VILGIGIGLLLSGILFGIASPRMSNYQIENLARQQGMVFPHELLPFNDYDKVNDYDKGGIKGD